MFWSGIFYYHITIGGKLHYSYMIRTSAVAAEVSKVDMGGVEYYGDNCRVWSWVKDKIEEDRKIAENLGLTFEASELTTSKR